MGWFLAFLFRSTWHCFPVSFCAFCPTRTQTEINQVFYVSQSIPCCVGILSTELVMLGSSFGGRVSGAGTPSSVGLGFGSGDPASASHGGYPGPSSWNAFEPSYNDASDDPHSEQPPHRPQPYGGGPPDAVAGTAGGAANDDSPPTSAPASAAPGMDDGFASFLMQRVAKQLGMEYSPSMHGRGGGDTFFNGGGVPGDGFGTGAFPIEGPTDAGNIVTPFAAAGVGGDTTTPHPELLKDGASFVSDAGATAVSVAAVLRAIDTRVRALGPTHPSVAALHIAAADRLAHRGHAARAESHAAQAVAALASHFGPGHASLVGPLGRLGALRTAVGNYAAARDAFTRAADIAGALADAAAGGVGGGRSAHSAATTDAAAGNATDSASAAASARVRKLLASVRGTNAAPAADTQRAVAGGVVAAWTAAVYDTAARRGVGASGGASRSDGEAQTDAAVAVAGGSAAVSAFDAQRPPPVRVAVAQPGEPWDPPPLRPMSDAQRARAVAHGARAASDLRSLVDYVSRPDAASAADETARAIGALSPTPLRRPAGAGVGATTVTAQGSVLSTADIEAASPRAEAAERQARELRATIDRLKALRGGAMPGAGGPPVAAPTAAPWAAAAARSRSNSVAAKEPSAAVSVAHVLFPPVAGGSAAPRPLATPDAAAHHQHHSWSDANLHMGAGGDDESVESAPSPGSDSYYY